MELLERGWSDERIAAELGTTAIAVNIARKRHGIPSRTATLLSCRAVADRLGIPCSKTITRWIEVDWLRGKHGPVRGPYAQWQVHPDDLTAFLENPEHWHRWHPERIPDPALRSWAADFRRGVRFLTLTEVADRMCVQAGTVHQWIKKGFLPAVRNGNHLVRESDLDAFTLPQIGGSRVVHPDHAVLPFRHGETEFRIEIEAVDGRWAGRVRSGEAVVWESRRPLTERKNVVGSCQRAAKRIADRRAAS